VIKSKMPNWMMIHNKLDRTMVSFSSPFLAFVDSLQLIMRGFFHLFETIQLHRPHLPL